MYVYVCFIGLRILSLKIDGGWKYIEQIECERTSIKENTQSNGNKWKTSYEKIDLKKQKNDENKVKSLISAPASSEKRRV